MEDEGGSLKVAPGEGFTNQKPHISSRGDQVEKSELHLITLSLSQSRKYTLVKLARHAGLQM